MFKKWITNILTLVLHENKKHQSMNQNWTTLNVFYFKIQVFIQVYLMCWNLKKAPKSSYVSNWLQWTNALSILPFWRKERLKRIQWGSNTRRLKPEVYYRRNSLLYWMIVICIKLNNSSIFKIVFIQPI